MAMAVKRVVCEPFLGKYWYWAPLQALQRFVTTMCMVFSMNAGGSTLWATVVRVWFLVFQLQARPYRKESVNSLQRVCCFCLVFLGLFSIMGNSFLDVGFDPHSLRNANSSIVRLCFILDLAILLVLGLPLVMCGLLKCCMYERSSGLGCGVRTIAQRQEEKEAEQEQQQQQQQEQQEILLLRQEVLDKEVINMQLLHTIGKISYAQRKQQESQHAEKGQFEAERAQFAAGRAQLAAEKTQLAAEKIQLEVHVAQFAVEKGQSSVKPRGGGSEI
jgi:hypothetical protein